MYTVELHNEIDGTWKKLRTFSNFKDALKNVDDFFAGLYYETYGIMRIRDTQTDKSKYYRTDYNPLQAYLFPTDFKMIEFNPDDDEKTIIIIERD